MAAPTHALYVDDSGTKEYSRDDTYGSHNTRHFVFGGPFLALTEARRLTAELRKLKTRVFGTSEVEIKSNWLRQRHEAEKRYLKKFSKTQAELDAFVEEYVSLVLAADLMLIAGVVDKVQMRETYGPAAWYPPAAAYEILVQRAQIQCGDWGLDPAEFGFFVAVDEMSGATPAGNQYRDNLRRHHNQLRRSGSLLCGMKFPHLRELIFIDSQRAELIQVADLVAYNVFRQFRDHGEEWETQGLAKLPTYDWFRRIAEKFRTDESGRIQGYGVVKIPLRTRVKWGIRR